MANASAIAGSNSTTFFMIVLVLALVGIPCEKLNHAGFATATKLRPCKGGVNNTLVVFIEEGRELGRAVTTTHKKQNCRNGPQNIHKKH